MAYGKYLIIVNIKRHSAKNPQVLIVEARLIIMKSSTIFSIAILLFVFSLLLAGCAEQGAQSQTHPPQGAGTAPMPPKPAEKVEKPVQASQENGAGERQAKEEAPAQEQQPEGNSPPTAPSGPQTPAKTSEEIDAEILAKVQRGAPDEDFELVNWDKQKAQF